MSQTDSPFLQSCPVFCMITAGAVDPENFETAKFNILNQITLAAEAGIHIVQIREKLISARQLCELTEESVRICAGSRTSVLVNERFDVALAAGAAGVHLRSTSMDARLVRSVTPEGFVIGVSTHTLKEAGTAASRGADYIIYGPVFDTPSKREFGEPKGLARLERVCAGLQGFPVIAVGGIDMNNFDEIANTGAAGIAAIRLFENPHSFRGLAGTDEN